MDTNPENIEPAEANPLEIENQSLRDELAAVHKQLEKAREIAREMDDCRSEEEELKARAKKAKENKDILADALANLVKGDTQTEIGEIIDPSDLQQPIEWTPQMVEERRAAGDVLTLGPDAITWDALEVAALSELASTGKPQKVKPVQLFGKDYVATDVVDRVVSLLPVLTREEWDDRTANSIPMELPNSERSAELEALGPHAGIPVKVGRSVRYLAPDGDALLVKMPEEKARPVAPFDDEEPPRDYGLIANRIIAQVQSGPYGDDAVTVSMIANDLDLPETIIRAAIKQSDKLRYFDDAEDDPAIEII